MAGQDSTVHPHACGEHCSGDMPSALMIGSSPRMWGTLLSLLDAFPDYRFIPTHVGNTTLVAASFVAVLVHPHACGEHQSGLETDRTDGGSSPRMWGTHQRPHSAHRESRFIPTHVGNTSSRRHMSQVQPVHPHACGEHHFTLRNLRTGTGSSPRMWGTQRSSGASFLRERFIPTHVGNTCPSSIRPIFFSVHPHACGEHNCRISRRRSTIGSSPRMWGTRKSGKPNEGPTWFIPTHVGNTWQMPNPPLRLSVHPHACGEHSRPESNGVMVVGSSPRMWGTPPLVPLARDVQRFIPTHVGNTLPVII